MNRAAGFTMVELVMVIVILGVMSVVAISSLSGANEFRALEFRDRTVAALRFAQKTALSHRRMVCVGFTVSTVTLTIDATRTGTACGAALKLPGEAGNTVTSADPGSAIFAPVPAAFIFLPDGTASASLNVAITGQQTITISGVTGYVK